MKIILFANTDWYLYNFRRSLALALHDAGHDLLLISPAGPYGAKLLDLGLRWEAVPMERRSLNPVRETAFIWYLYRLFKREKPAFVHSFTIKCAVYGALAARMARVPWRINAVAGMGYVFTSNDTKARVLRPIVRSLLKLALDGPGTRLILQNQDDVAFFKRTGLTQASRIHLIRGSGVDCTRFTIRQRMASTATPMTVLLAARLLWDKGIAEYIEAAKLLLARGRAIRFLLAGNSDAGNPAAVPEATVGDWVHNGYIDWLGHVDDMAALLETVDVVVLPSYREGLPKTLIEAAACALPLVTTDVPGCREVVKDGVNGLLVQKGDALGLADAIARIQDQPEFARCLGMSARDNALENFDERIVIERTIEVYAEASQEGRR